MLRRYLVIAAMAVLVAAPALAKEPLRVLQGCTVVRVVDGDTLNADCSGTNVKVRLYGIDAPETPKINYKTSRMSKPGQPYGEQAQLALGDKVFNRSVTLDVVDIDRYKRAVCVVWLGGRGGRNINREMVSEGRAWSYRQYLATPYRSEWLHAEQRARGAGRGLWQDSNPEPPWEFRKRTKTR